MNILNRSLTLFLLLSLQAWGNPAQRPNILFIFSDDHATQAISAYKESRRLIETPNIDRLAKEGMIFQRCLVTNSICGPSRATIQTGTYSHINGFYNNSNSVFNGDQITFPKLLQAAGYQTAIVGKWHLEGTPLGYDFWQILPGQGEYYQPTMTRNGEKINCEGHITDITVNATLDWLKTKRDPTKPFLMMLQQKAPHREWEPRIEDLNFDNDRVYPEPETLFDDYQGRGPAVKDQKMSIIHDMKLEKDLKLKAPKNLNPEQLNAWNAYYEPRNAAFLNANLQGKDLLKWKYQRYMHDYLACIKGVDETVGQVLKYLDESGLAKNTIVIYSADQGFYLGEHGWFDKRWVFEESLSTPLLVRWPGVINPGSVNKDMVSNLDFAETFLDIAGVPIPDVMQGKSLVSIFNGQTPTDWRTSFYYEYFEYPGIHKVRPHYAVITDRYKLVKVHGPGGDPYTELFDLKTDPHEMKSQYDNPEYASVIKQLEVELSRLRTELKVPDIVAPSAFGTNKEEKTKTENKKAADNKVKSKKTQS